jgi:hypothetical protein
MVVVDRLTKMIHLIPCPNIETPTVVDLFVDHVWKLHGLPDSIVSDRGSQFVSAFWKTLCHRLNITSRLSTAFHPESDGQTERFNAMIEQVLRGYVSYLQDDWKRLLAMVEFSINNGTSDTTRTSPFFANYGQHPRMGYEPPVAFHGPRPQRQQAQQANEFVDKMIDIQDYVRQEMVWAQALYEEKANANRTPAPAYRVGDRVWLNARNIQTKRPSEKLDWKNLGPFPVEAVVSPHAYRLTLPSTMRIHPVFHTNLLRPAVNEDEALPGQVQPEPPPLEVNSDGEYWEVERIEDSRFNRRRRRYEYLVKWTGYNRPDWEPADELILTDACNEFHERYPDKPRPPP